MTAVGEVIALVSHLLLAASCADWMCRSKKSDPKCNSTCSALVIMNTIMRALTNHSQLPITIIWEGNYVKKKNSQGVFPKEYLELPCQSTLLG